MSERRTTALVVEVEAVPTTDERRTTALVVEVEVSARLPRGVPGKLSHPPERGRVALAPIQAITPSVHEAAVLPSAERAGAPSQPSPAWVRAAHAPAIIVKGPAPEEARLVAKPVAMPSPGVFVAPAGKGRTMRIAEVVRQIKPYVVGWIQSEAVNAVSTLGFLKTDGSRDLAGSMDVSDGATVDGVDIDGAQKLDILRW